MKSLNKTVSKKYAYVKNEVIFKISNYDSGDGCAIEMTIDNVPSITVNGTPLYFDSYIEEGDVFDGRTFKKSLDCLGDTMRLEDYYNRLCNEEVANTIITQYWNDYEYFENNLGELGIPTYMFKGQATVEPSDIQIDFTEEYYTEAKENKVKEMAYKAACDKAYVYGYKITTPDSAERLQIELLT